MRTKFPQKQYHMPKWFFIDATGKMLGRLASDASNLLMGKKNSFFNPSLDQGNYVIIYNAEKVAISGKKESQKLYFRNSNRPGSLKTETYKQLQNRIPSRIIEKAIRGMLPKSILGRMFYKRLYVYSNKEIRYKKDFLDTIMDDKWIKYE